MNENYLKNIISICCHYKNKTIWFPYYMDFRGRIYPHANAFSHYGSDLERSLFVFSKKKAVGQKGLEKLKIYFSTLFNGSKILSDHDHIKFTDSFIHIIHETARNPKNNLWWLKKDKPFQLLSVCNEIYNTMKNIDSYQSGFPIYIDATSSSFQHVAALTKDEKLAKLTNLSDASARYDLYTYFSDVLNRNHPDINVDRTFSKKGIISFLYGNKNLAGQSSHKFALINTPGSTSLYNKLVKCIMFEEFPAINYLYKWASMIISLFKKKKYTIQWDTPLNIPITLYRKEFTQITLRYACYETYFVPKYFDVDCKDDYYRQSKRWYNIHNVKYQHILSNYVQSMDACLMMLIVMECFKKNLSIASIHDSFGTHPVDIDHINQIGRYCFSNFYNEEHLHNLYTQLNERLNFLSNNNNIDSSCIFEPFSYLGKFDVNIVKHNAINMFK